jgi:ISXO2 transposase-like protein
VKAVKQAADIAMQSGSRLYTDSASSYRASTGYAHAFVNHTKKEYARVDVHENRAECLFAWPKPDLRMFHGINTMNLPGYLGAYPWTRFSSPCQ